MLSLWWMPASAPSPRWCLIHRGQGLARLISLSTRFLAASKLEDKMVHRPFSDHGGPQFAPIQLTSLTAQDMVAMTKRPAGAMLTLLTVNTGRKSCHGAHQQLSDEDDPVQSSNSGLALFSHREWTFSSDYGGPYFYLWRRWVYFVVSQHPLGDVLFLLRFLPDKDWQIFYISF